ncbi:MAG: hypothetical protein ACP5PX_03700 [Candidatus Hadarchaeum sp.]|uniref:hypothetical protein n=1 Tax=Candidatus Hadarchaeum sp. TaxID=2883567 RepID=UPI003D112F77
MLQRTEKRIFAEEVDFTNGRTERASTSDEKVNEFGAVCDVSVLTTRDNFEKSRQIFSGGGLYLPSATYSWLSRDKLISVRGLTVGYSLVNQFVRDGELIVVYLPELLDEISRRLLYGAEREIPLTDLRASMLAAYLKMPILTFGDQLIERLSDHLGAKTIWRLDVHPDRGSLLTAIDLYWELASDLGSYLSRHQNNGVEFEVLVEELRRIKLDSLRMRTARMLKNSPQPPGSGSLNLAYVGWDITTIMREYLEQKIIPPEVARGLYEKSLLLIASLDK